MLTVFRGGVAVLMLDYPPVNSLRHELRRKIFEDVQAVVNDPGVRGMVLAGTDRAFSAGADIAEIGTPKQFDEPILREVIERIEASPKPVVAAITGLALGGGLELALGCHGRVAAQAARVGMPEIMLGLIPGAGGTQRLTRLIGAQAALSLIVGGQAVAAKDLAATGLFDELVGGDVVGAAVRHVLELVESGRALPRARDREVDAQSTQDAVQSARSKLDGRQRLQPAYEAALAAVDASTLPFDEGLRRERELFVALVPSVAARALRYQFQSQREAVRPPEGMSRVPRTVRHVAVIGAGTMGTGIAIAALDAGLDVVLVEQSEAALLAGRQRIGEHYHKRVTSGKMQADVAQQAGSRLRVTTDWADLGQADLVVEAVFEELSVKREVFGKLDVHAKAGAILATNTSYLDIDAVASATSRPQDVLGLHFFSPAHVMKLLEVVRGGSTSPEALAMAMDFGHRLKKVPVLCRNAFGFIGNRIYNAYRRQCEFMLEDGAWPEDVDNALTAMGFAMGPFAVADLSGLDIAWRMRRAQAATRDPRERYVAVLDRLCELGRLGRKAGAGYYTYAQGQQSRATDPIVRELIEQASAQRGIVRRPLAAREIQRRALLAMVNEAALLLDEGVASRAADVDVVMVEGYGFPRWEGGPVFWARREERAQLQADLQELMRDAGHGAVLGSLDRLLQA